MHAPSNYWEKQIGLQEDGPVPLIPLLGGYRPAAKKHQSV
jgi:hypothetical protein